MSSQLLNISTTPTLLQSSGTLVSESRSSTPVDESRVSPSSMRQQEQELDSRPTRHRHRYFYDDTSSYDGSVGSSKKQPRPTDKNIRIAYFDSREEQTMNRLLELATSNPAEKQWFNIIASNRVLYYFILVVMILYIIGHAYVLQSSTITEITFKAYMLSLRIMFGLSVIVSTITLIIILGSITNSPSFLYAELLVNIILFFISTFYMSTLVYIIFYQKPTIEILESWNYFNVNKSVLITPKGQHNATFPIKDGSTLIYPTNYKSDCGTTDMFIPHNDTIFGTIPDPDKYGYCLFGDKSPRKANSKLDCDLSWVPSVGYCVTDISSIEPFKNAIHDIKDIGVTQSRDISTDTLRLDTQNRLKAIQPSPPTTIINIGGNTAKFITWLGLLFTIILTLSFIRGGARGYLYDINILSFPFV